MRKSILCAIACMGILSTYAAPAPYPLTVNSRAQTAPPVLVYKANEAVFRVTFTDGDTPSDLTGCTPFMSWATNAAALVNSTSSVSVVGISTGLVDFTFSPSSVNYTAGRYVYEVGVLTAGGLPRVFRQGTFTIYDSPVGAGAGAIAWSTNVTWSSVAWIGLPDVTINGVVGNIKTSVVYTVTADSAQTAVVVTGVQSNLIATALQPADTNGWETGSHTALLPSAATNGWTVSEHAAWLTNAWQNPASAADWTWTSDGTQITLTSYTGPNDVVIPDMLDGLPVTGFGKIFSPDTTGSAITSIIGGANITTIDAEAFTLCDDLTSAIFPSATTIGGYAFYHCDRMTTIAFPAATIIGESAMSYCLVLSRVYFSGNAPTEGLNIYGNLPANQVTNYVTSATAMGWGSTFGGMPVVRMPLYGDGSNITGITALQVGAVATNAIPGPGCTDLGATNGPTISGATVSYLASPTTAYTLSVSASAPRYCYAIEILSTNACTLGAGISLRGTWTPSATNTVVLVPYTGTLYYACGRAL